MDLKCVMFREGVYFCLPTLQLYAEQQSAEEGRVKHAQSLASVRDTLEGQNRALQSENSSLHLQLTQAKYVHSL